MDEIRKKISLFMLKLQSQTQLPLWSLAHQDVIFAHAIQQKHRWGKRTRVLFLLIKAAHKMAASDGILYLTAMGRIIFLWYKIRFMPKKAVLSAHTKKIFAGFGAAAEEFLYADFAAENSGPILRLNWVTHAGFDQIGCPKLIPLLSRAWRYSFGHTAKIKKCFVPDTAAVLNFLTVSALNLGPYLFYRAYLHLARQAGIDEVTVLAPDMFAMASVDEGMNTVFLQHGLMLMTLLVPPLTRIQTLTRDEAYYLTALLSGTEVSAPILKINAADKNHSLLLLPPHQITEQDIQHLKQLIDWAILHGLRIIIRPVPIQPQEKIIIYRRLFPLADIDDLSLSFERCLDKWLPKFVASWWSTGLAVALQYGSVPISLSSVHTMSPLCNMIYPLEKRVLFWPRDEEEIREAMYDKTKYYNQLTKLGRP